MAMRTLSVLYRFRRPSRFSILLLFVVLWVTHGIISGLFTGQQPSHSPVITLNVHPMALQEVKGEKETNIPVPRISPPPPPPLSTKKDYYPFCAPNECGKGHWIPRSTPFSTLAQVQDAFPSNDFALCEVHHTTPTTHEELQHARENRTIDISNWIWKPDNGLLMPWDADELVARLYQSPGGLILVGDSLTRQHSQTMVSMLHQSGLLLDEIRPKTAWTPTIHITQLRLFHYEPANQRAIRMADVPRSRIDRPFLTIIEDHSLLQSEEIKMLSRRKPDKYFFQNSPSVPNWQGFIEYLIEDRGEDGVTKDSVVLLNAGSHWNLGELSPFLDDYDQLDHVVTQMINQIITRLSILAKTTIYFRSTSPGHPTCDTKSLPYSSITEAHNNEVDVDGRNTAISNNRKNWSWGSFSRHNEFWKRAIEESNIQRDGVWKGNGATWKYLDVWDMSLQRVDAHSLLKSGDLVDCLHYCVPFVVREWTHLFAHAILVDELVVSLH